MLARARVLCTSAVLLATICCSSAHAAWPRTPDPDPSVPPPIDPDQNVTIVSDGAGGAIVTWSDFRGGDPKAHIYAQRMNATGTPQWAADGVALCTATTGTYGH